MRKLQVQGMWHYCNDADLCYVDTAKAHSPPWSVSLWREGGDTFVRMYVRVYFNTCLLICVVGHYELLQVTQSCGHTTVDCGLATTKYC